MSDRPLWTRESDAELRCEAAVRGVAVSPDDVYLACLALDGSTVTVTHRASTDTIAVLSGRPVASLAWCAAEHLAILREEPISLHLVVHEMPDGGAVVAHRFERPGPGTPTLQAVPEARAAAVVCVAYTGQVEGSCRRVEVFSGPRLEARAAVDLRAVRDAALLARPELRGVALSPDGAAIALYVSSRRLTHARVVVVSLVDGAAVGSTADLPHPATSLHWVSPSHVLARCVSERASVLLQIDTAAGRVFARRIAARLIAHDLHPNRDRLLVTAYVSGEARPALLAAELSLDAASTEVATLRWRVEVNTVLWLLAAWDAQGAMVTAAIERGRVLRLTRWSDGGAGAEAVCWMDHASGSVREVSLQPTTSRRFSLLSWVLDDDTQRVSLVSV